MGHIQRFREKSRLRNGVSAAATEDEPDIVLKSGNLFVDRIDFPDCVAPDGVVKTTVKVSNGANLIFPTDPDAANGGAYEYVINVEGDWGATDRTGRQEINTTEIGTADRFHDLRLSAPSREGSGRITVELFLPGSRSRASDSVGPVSFDARCGSAPDPETDGDSDGGGPFLPCLLDPNRSCDSSADAALQGGFLLLLLLVTAGQLS